MEISSSQPAMLSPSLMGTSASANSRRSPAEVGQSFEAVFASMIVKQMRQNSDGESIFPNDRGDVIGGMFDQFLGDHIAKSHSLGVGRMIQSQLERRSGRT